MTKEFIPLKQILILLVSILDLITKQEELGALSTDVKALRIKYKNIYKGLDKKVIMNRMLYVEIDSYVEELDMFGIKLLDNHVNAKLVYNLGICVECLKKALEMNDSLFAWLRFSDEEVIEEWLM